MYMSSQFSAFEAFSRNLKFCIPPVVITIQQVIICKTVPFSIQRGKLKKVLNRSNFKIFKALSFNIYNDQSSQNNLFILWLFTMYLRLTNRCFNKYVIIPNCCSNFPTEFYYKYFYKLQFSNVLSIT